MTQRGPVRLGLMLVVVVCILGVVPVQCEATKRIRIPLVREGLKAADPASPQSGARYLGLRFPSGVPASSITGAHMGTLSASSPPQALLTGGNVYKGEFALGTPLKTFSFVVDTGSSDLVVVDSVCRECDPLSAPRDDCVGSCYAGKSRYDPKASTTGVRLPDAAGHTCSSEQCLPYCYYQTSCNCIALSEDMAAGLGQECGVEYLYGDGSAALGAVTQDLVCLYDPNTKAAVPNTSVLQSFSKLYRTGTSIQFPPRDSDGVLGFGTQSESMIRQPPYYQSLYEAGQISHLQFSINMNADGGILTLGATEEPSQYQGPLHYTGLLTSPTYAVSLDEIQIGTQSFTVDKWRALPDTGTTLIVVPTVIYADIKAAVQKGNCDLVGMCGQATVWDQLCYPWSLEEVQALPDMILKFNGLTATMKATDYMILHHMPGYDCYYAGIMGQDGQGIGILLGDPFFRAFYVVFDLENARMGLAPNTHSKAVLVGTASAGTQSAVSLVQLLSLTLAVVGSIAIVILVAQVAIGVVERIQARAAADPTANGEGLVEEGRGGLRDQDELRATVPTPTQGRGEDSARYVEMQTVAPAGRSKGKASKASKAVAGRGI